MSLRAGLRVPSSGPLARWAWALLLALVLPLSQGLAAGHAVSHHGVPAQQQPRDAAPSALDAACAQCLIATPIGAGALPSAPGVFVAARAAHAAPAAAGPADATSALALAYRSRAPPSPLH